MTFRIDTKLLAKAETARKGETKAKAAERLRQVVDTIGELEWAGKETAWQTRPVCGVGRHV